MDDYTFRREFDFASLFPDAIVGLKKSREFRRMNLTAKNEMYDYLYNSYKRYFLIGCVSKEEKSKIEDAAMQQLMERGRQELEKTLQ